MTGTATKVSPTSIITPVGAGKMGPVATQTTRSLQRHEIQWHASPSTQLERGRVARRRAC